MCDYLDNVTKKLKSSNLFDEEDICFVEEEKQRILNTDTSAIGLEQILFARQQVLQELDVKYKLSSYHKPMLEKFLQKDLQIKKAIDHKKQFINEQV